MKLKEIIRHKLKNEDIYIDWKNRFVTKDLENQNEYVTIDVCSKFEKTKKKFLDIFKDYKYSIYIETSDRNMPNGIYLPSYVEIHDDITFDIVVKETNNYRSYYQLIIKDKDGKDVDKDSDFTKTKEYRNEIYKEEFEFAKRKTLEVIENIKSEFNYQMSVMNYDLKI